MKKSATNATNVTIHPFMQALCGHSGDKTNKYDQCDYACHDSSNLRKHMKAHSGDESNKCNQCDYASSRSSQLRRHLKTHGEKS